MFTGLVETIGTIADVRRQGANITLGILPAQSDFEVAVGASVAVDGVCLTMEHCSSNMLFFTAVYETLTRTTLAGAIRGKKVNLERALPAGGRFDGHMVLGHVDGIGTMVSDRSVGGGVMRAFRVPSELTELMALKGSVALDGVSLTIASVERDTIIVSLIPHTLAGSTMEYLKAGEPVNIECDVIARYIRHLLDCRSAGQTAAQRDENLLQVMKRSGF
ncbi:MAG: riboflavin synthase [Chitinivibrionales bacterium]|nr:riboflavin synthase [Chitinivibrionales bacterium]MBD3358535.1 riboflavin synthase [Chitinivibrionales bacterium]